MADGEVVGRSEVLKSLMDHSSAIGGLKQMVEERPSFKQLMESNNELRRELGAKIDKSNELLGKQFSVDIENLKLTLSAQQGSMLDQAIARAMEAKRANDSAMIDQAVAKALEAERARESKARADIDNKAKDAVRGVKLMVTSQSWMIVLLVVTVAALVANNIFKWI